MNAPFRPAVLRSTLRKMGNSTGLILPRPILDELGLSQGAKIELRVENGEVIARPEMRKVREGWAEAAKRVGAAGLTEEERDWLEVPADFDDEWEW